MENALVSVSSFCSLIRRGLASANRDHKPGIRIYDYSTGVMLQSLSKAYAYSLMAELLPMLFRQWEIERYKGFLIAGSAVPTFATGFDWHAQGIIPRPGRLGSIVEIKRIKGPIFTTRKRQNNTVSNCARLD